MDGLAGVRSEAGSFETGLREKNEWNVSWRSSLRKPRFLVTKPPCFELQNYAKEQLFSWHSQRPHLGPRRSQRHRCRRRRITGTVRRRTPCRMGKTASTTPATPGTIVESTRGPSSRNTAPPCGGHNHRLLVLWILSKYGKGRRIVIAN